MGKQDGLRELLTPYRIILGGISGIMFGFLYALGADLYEAIRIWSFSPSLDTRSVVSTLLVLGGIVAIIYGVHALRKGNEQPDLRSRPLYRTLDELPPLAPLFTEAKFSVIVFAMDAGLLTTKYYDDLRNVLLSGKFVRFMLLYPMSKLIDSMEKAWPMNEPYSTLVGSLDRISRLKTELPSTLKSHLEIRFYDLLPIHTMMIIDHEGENPTMQVTLHRYNSQTWSYLKFSKREEPDLFEKYWQSYKYAESKSWEPGDVPRPS